MSSQRLSVDSSLAESAVSVHLNFDPSSGHQHSSPNLASVPFCNRLKSNEIPILGGALSLVPFKLLLGSSVGIGRPGRIVRVLNPANTQTSSRFRVDLVLLSLDSTISCEMAVDLIGCGGAWEAGDEDSVRRTRWRRAS